MYHLEIYGYLNGKMQWIPLRKEGSVKPIQYRSHADAMAEAMRIYGEDMRAKKPTARVVKSPLLFS